MNLFAQNKEKFSNPEITADGSPRAKVALTQLNTLWFNTGSQCNFTCENCYMESSPTNDTLIYISNNNVLNYLNQIKDLNLPTSEIGLTGGEPFLNPEIILILKSILSYGHKAIVLTNAVRMINRHKDELLELNKAYPKQITLRVSLDHYTQAVHEKERGEGSFKLALKNLKWMSDSKIPFHIAGRSLVHEDINLAKESYQNLLNEHSIHFHSNVPENIIIFPEMDENQDTPEITTQCWSILNKNPNDIMCSTSRMVVHKKGQDLPVIVACTLLPYDDFFETGNDLKTMNKNISLKHKYCSQFCVLGGASCS